MSDLSAKQEQREAEENSSWGAEEKRLRAIRNGRRERLECVMCGKPLGFFDKRAKREQHQDCTKFVP